MATEVTDGCVRCTEVKKSFTKKEKNGPVKRVLLIHTKYDVLRESVKKNGEEKKTFTYNVAIAVSALRNSGGGSLLVHVEGTSEEDRCLEYFDEATRKVFMGLLESGELYTDIYKRKCLCQTDIYKDVTDFVLVEVLKVDNVCTVDYNTKLNNDSDNLSVNSLNIKQLLRKPERQTCSSDNVGNLPDDVQELHENRHIQLKTFNPKYVKPIKSDPKKLTDYIWDRLKLKDNITAMSKVVGGGSYYLGVKESRITTKEGYVTKIPEYTGFKLDITQDSLETHIYKKLESDVCVLDAEGKFKEGSKDLIKIIFYELPKQDSQLVVLEVAIRYCNGVVFYDKQGPKAYVIRSGGSRTDQVCRMDRGEWLQRSQIMTSHACTQTVDSVDCPRQDISVQ